jgi:phosphatidylinositol dimannoside acyltransferase
LSYAVSQSVGLVVYYLFGAMRDVWTSNIRQVTGGTLDDPALRQTMRLAYRNYFQFLVDWLRLPYLSPKEVSQIYRVSGWEYMDAALARGKGVIFASFHMGSWEMAGSLVADRGYQISTVVDSFKPERMNDLIQKVRTKKGVTIIPLENAAPGLIRALRNNNVLALLVDRPSGANGVRVNFCGATASVPGGPAQLALRTGATILTGALVRNPDGTSFGAIDPPLEFERTGDKTEMVRMVTQKIMERMEVWVRRYPDQWYMFRPMWETPSAIEPTQR